MSASLSQSQPNCSCVHQSSLGFLTFTESLEDAATINLKDIRTFTNLASVNFTAVVPWVPVEHLVPKEM
ncbi:hypothetical protein PPACK8108_LOCUS3791 [Phakopsora pachyrhizi]|uniref:Uncharacterized protein n=1 Tax=Phakopsora pachyrhizi TaxID=170000 RepID=A0AAV0AKV5_PHAPC|nr:hypothetical protein PPACK8108_LOCUS3791 [Phakopsora pachyrhizi]